jgi:hypothetical protein
VLVKWKGVSTMMPRFDSRRSFELTRYLAAPRGLKSQAAG